MALDVFLLKVLEYEVCVVIFQVVEQDSRKEIFFVVLIPIRMIFTLLVRFSRFQLEITFFGELV